MIFTEHVLDSGAVPDSSTTDTLEDVLYRVARLKSTGWLINVSLLGLK